MTKKKNPASTPQPPPPAQAEPTAPGPAAARWRKHSRIGWSLLALWVTLGLVLETLHGLKLGWYLNLDHETRRLMLTLAHTHGTVFGLLNLVYAHARWPGGSAPSALASHSLALGTFLMPVGFLLGGLFALDGDPGLGVLLAPLGGLLVALSLFLTARTAFGSAPAPGSSNG